MASIDQNESAPFLLSLAVPIKALMVPQIQMKHMVGIDLEKGKQIPMPAQKSLLRSFVKVAVEKQLPLQIHSRFDDGKYLVFNCSDVLCVIFSPQVFSP